MERLTHEQVDEEIRKILEPPKRPTSGQELLQKLLGFVRGQGQNGAQ